jgi:probable rRNA maturation factor
MKHRAHVRTELEFEPTPEIQTAAVRTLARIQAPDGELTIQLTDSDEVRRLNRQFRGEDRPTDVLSFSDGEIDPDTGMRYHGDVVIALPVARAQAEKAGHSLEAELSLLTIHGVLHLFGHDHASKDEEAEMWSLQGEILTSLGLPDTQKRASR